MTFGDRRDFHELMLRAYVRNMMFLATLPYHLNPLANPKASHE
jgi:hypothetical protein